MGSTQLFSQILLGHTLFDGFLCIEYDPSKKKLKDLFSISCRTKNFKNRPNLQIIRKNIYNFYHTSKWLKSVLVRTEIFSSFKWYGISALKKSFKSTYGAKLVENAKKKVVKFHFRGRWEEGGDVLSATIHIFWFSMILAVQHDINFDFITVRSEIVDFLVVLNIEFGRIFE